MKRRLRILSNIAIICLSVCMFAFGVYAASSVSVTTSGTVTFSASGVYANVSRTVSGYDEAKSTGVITSFSQDIDSSTSDNHIFDTLKNEKFVFQNAETPIVMTFTITNKAEDRNLKYVLSGESTGTGIKTKLMTGERLILIDDDNYLDPYVEGDDAFVNTATVTITFTVADSNASGELSYNYNFALSNVENVVSDNLTITSTNSNYGTSEVITKAGNTIKLRTAVNAGGQFSGFTTTQSVNLDENLCGVESEGEDYSAYITALISTVRVVGNTSLTSLTSLCSQFDSNKFELEYYSGYELFGMYIYTPVYKAKSSATFTETELVIPQYVCVSMSNSDQHLISGVDFNNCASNTSIKNISLPVTNSRAPGLTSLKGVTSLTIPENWGIGDSYHLDLTSSALYYTTSNLNELYLDSVGKFDYGENQCFDNDNYMNFNLEVIEVSPYNPYYHSKNNAIINSETNMLVATCKTTVIEEGVLSLGMMSLYHCTTATISLPASIKEIGSTAFSSTITTINFAGTTSQWNEITYFSLNWSGDSYIESSLEFYGTSLKVVCSDGEIILK